VHVVFDLDGCLIDTEGLIRQSYRDAGVEPPDNILAHEGTNWLANRYADQSEYVACLAHKNQAYLRHLANDPLWILPPYDVAVRLWQGRHDVSLLSGAPVGAINILQNRRLSPCWPFHTLTRAGVRTPDKMKILTTFTRGGVYVDDQARLVDVPDGWEFIHYRGQTADELYEELRKVKTWNRRRGT
jgi:phosphoglycolate phosphatase-like HAD superfamily hydrolase